MPVLQGHPRQHRRHADSEGLMLRVLAGTAVGLAGLVVAAPAAAHRRIPVW